jgi:hypothetical protein
MRKYNPSILEQFKELKSINVPKYKRREYAKYMTGVCNYFSGATSQMDSAIDEAYSQGMWGVQAIGYIDRQMRDWERKLNRELVETSSD